MNYTKEEMAYIWLDSFFEWDRFALKIVEEAGSALNFATNMDKFCSFLVKSRKDGVYNSMKRSLADGKYIKKLLKDLEEHEIVAVTRASEYYPERLYNLDDPPLVLYCRGDISLLKGRKFGIVGSRRTRSDVLKQTEKMSEGLSEHFVIITGIAEGGDTAALTGALNTGNAISFLPCGHGEIYPSSNRNFYEEVSRNALTVSEYTYHVKAQKFTFPARNRLIAALSEGVLVVSAGEKSGALSTAYKALDMGADLFAFPYGLGVLSGVGCNALIKKGAFLCDDIVDILSCFGIDFKEAAKIQLSEEEEALLKLIREKGSAHALELSVQLGLEVSALNVLLLSLEMQGLIVRMGGNRYSAV